MRKQAKLTQRQLAAKIDVDHTYISKLEHDAPPPSLKIIKQVAFVLSARLQSDSTTLTDRLTLMAGKLPPDIVGILCRHPHMIAQLRELENQD